MQTKILIADNDRAHLEIMTGFLKRKGYSVVVARNVPEAKRVLQKANVKLALLDVRLTEESDRYDLSGLTLASLAPNVPKIVVTKYPTYLTVRMALRSVGGAPPVAIDFVSKPQKLAAIQVAIEGAVANALQVAQFKEFFEHLQNGNREAWKILWDKEAWRLITLVQRHGFSRTVAQNVCFEVFRDLAQAPRLPRTSALKTTLVNETVRKIKILAKKKPGKQGNLTRMALRKTAASPVKLGLAEDIVAPVINHNVSKARLLKHLKNAIGDLPVREQKAIVMHLFEANSPDEIARKLNLGSKTVTRYLRDGGAHLEAKLAELK